MKPCGTTASPTISRDLRQCGCSRLFKAGIDEGAREQRAVLRGHPVTAQNGMPAALDRLLHLIDEGSCVRLIETEALTLTQEIFAVGVAIETPDGERQIPPLNTDQWVGRQVIGGSKLKVLPGRNQPVVSRMIVRVGDQCVENHAAKELTQVG